MRRHIPLTLLILIVLVGAPQSASAQPIPEPACFDIPGIVDCIYLPEFVQYWSGNGGLPVFGYPVTPDDFEYNQDADDMFITQWFERNRLEAHPGNAAPYNVLLGRLGAELLALQGRGFESPTTAPTGRCQRFDVGGREQQVCDPFLSYWQSHGLEFDGQPGTSFNESLALFGLPLTAPKMETNPNGDTVMTQWFERARFEDHGSKGVLLGLLGLETLRTPVPGQPVIPIVDGESGFLLGGSRGGVWVGPGMAAAQLRGGETYQLSTLNGAAGQTTGGRATRTTGEPCSWVQWVPLNPEGPVDSVGIAAASWNVRPRAPVDLGTQLDVYRDAVANILRANGIPNPEVRLTRVLRVDLEGDGVDEVVLTATRLVEGPSSPAVAAGDYSIALLRKVIDGEVRTIMLAESYFIEADTFIAPSEFTVTNLVDLNGDGRLEIMVNWQYYEGSGVIVHDIVGNQQRSVLEEGCGV